MNIEQAKRIGIMSLNVLGWLISCVFQVLWTIITLVLGVFIVPISLYKQEPVDSTSLSDGRPIKVLAHKWAWLWSNSYDGTDGDKRGWWNSNCDQLVLWGLLPKVRQVIAHFNEVPWVHKIELPVIDQTHFLARWWWLVVRNPVNNDRLLPLISCPIQNCVVHVLAGPAVVSDSDSNPQWGTQFLRADHKSIKGLWWWGLYSVTRLKIGQKFWRLRVRIGHKITVGGRDNKGWTFSLNLTKLAANNQ